MITRPFLSNLLITPDQYLDNASLVLVPEPASVVMLGLGLAGVVALARRRGGLTTAAVSWPAHPRRPL